MVPKNSEFSISDRTMANGQQNGQNWTSLPWQEVEVARCESYQKQET